MKDIYPLTIIADRYSGAYSGGMYLAFNMDFWDIPEPIGGGDSEEENFYRGTYIIYGKGRTPIEAFDDLYKKINK